MPGHWKCGRRHGFGVQFYSLRSWYEGQWSEGAAAGWGRRVYADGSSYEGGWMAGRRDGVGLYKDAKGGRFEVRGRGRGEHLKCLCFANVNDWACAGHLEKRRSRGSREAVAVQEWSSHPGEVGQWDLEGGNVHHNAVLGPPAKDKQESFCMRGRNRFDCGQSWVKKKPPLSLGIHSFPLRAKGTSYIEIYAMSVKSIECLNRPMSYRPILPTYRRGSIQVSVSFRPW